MKPLWSLAGMIAVAGRPSYQPIVEPCRFLPAHRQPGARLLLAHAGVAWARKFSLSLLPNPRAGLSRPTYPTGCNFIGCARCRPVVCRHINRKTLDHIILYGFVFSDPTLSHR